MAQQGHSSGSDMVSSRRRNRKAGGKGVKSSRTAPRMKGALANKFKEFERDAARREQSHAQKRGYQVQSQQIGKFDHASIEASLRGQEYVPQLNEVSAISEQQLAAATTYRRFEKERKAVGKMDAGSLAQHEQGALEQRKQEEEERFVRLKKEEQMEHVLRERVKQLMD